MYQGTLGPNEPNGLIAYGYTWHTPNTFNYNLAILLRLFKLLIILLLLKAIRYPKRLIIFVLLQLIVRVIESKY